MEAEPEIKAQVTPANGEVPPTPLPQPVTVPPWHPDLMQIHSLLKYLAGRIDEHTYRLGGLEALIIPTLKKDRADAKAQAPTANT